MNERSALIGIIGLGYVGLPLVLRFCEEGFKVCGFDIDREKADKLNRGESYIKHISSEKVRQFVDRRLFEATVDMQRLKEADAIIICVPTPLTDKREPDMQYVEATAREVARHLRPGQLISLESTTYPGTTEELLLPLLTEKGLKVGRDFFLVFSPEREDPGRKDFTTKTTPKIVGGITEKCLLAGEALYSKIVDKVVKVSSPKAAEMTKLLENIYRSVNIALVNELKMLCDRMGIDVWEVIEAAKTKPFGFEAFYPGPGLGGHCIPVDPFYLTWKAREYDFSTRFIELAGEINTNMPYYVVSKVMEALNSKGKSLKGSKVLVLGVAYKKDIDDMRESPSVHLIELLIKKGAVVEYNDPYVLRIPKLRGHNLNMKSVELKEISGYDCILIATNHSSYNYKWIVDNSQLVVDTRNATSRIKSKNIVKA
ncbi:UDP-N-acetyl-D-glucosamine dehydrogenase [Candidatus Woesebacteria bacterium RIFCSPLOWO2_01_FULL_39_23]|nr:MAG: UDP-N-acetyl-D-glucosamine dehydrogenase [Candidatus Woesebacteria bacterium RIFCSPLOWO2_01_FULL_39_23]